MAENTVELTKPTLTPKYDYTGLKFNKLTVISYYGKRNGSTVWLCKCDCENMTYQSISKMRLGYIKSCGCWKNEAAKQKMTKHGLYKTPEYHIWESIKQRCCNKNSKPYKDYGGRGIFVCDEWKNNPKAFCEWAKTHGYKKGLEIDRINNNMGYSPDNCRFVDRKIQSLNKRSNIFITYNGITDNICSWAKRLGVNYQLLHYRLKRGWSVEKTLTTPPLNQKKSQEITL